MYKRESKECEALLKHKTELLTKLETQKEDMANTIANLEKTWSTDKSNLGEILKNTSETLSTQVNASEERANRAEQRAIQAETATMIEREWRVSLQQKEIKLKEQNANLQSYVQDFKSEVQKNGKLKAELDKLHHQWSEAQRTLEELGVQLSESKLKISELEDKEKRQKQLLQNSTMNAMNLTGGAAGIWAPDSIATHCTACKKEFNLTRRRHHCRSCGEIFCNSCSDHSLALVNENGQVGKPVRVCLVCFASQK
uniref:FYVE-type domain-containing protein n=1 Tax=Glossina brevipalpis TaxID=37001 RepID=A0A1A9W7Z1_9MUSC